MAVGRVVIYHKFAPRGKQSSGNHPINGYKMHRKRKSQADLSVSRHLLLSFIMQDILLDVFGSADLLPSSWEGRVEHRQRLPCRSVV
jgi:hypothetical protein